MFCLLKRSRKQLNKSVYKQYVNISKSVGLALPQLVLSQSEQQVNISEAIGEVLDEQKCTHLTTVHFAEDQQQWLQVGTYCQVVKQKQFRQQWVFRGLQRVRLLNMVGWHHTKGILLDNNANPLEQKDNQLIQQTGLFQLEIEGLSNRIELDFNLEMKMRYLLESYQKIIYSQVGDMPKMNYNLKDVNKILDMVCVLLSQNDYLGKAQLIELYTCELLEERVELVVKAVKSYVEFLQRVSELGQKAQQNIKQRRMQEVYDEMARIVKSNLSSQSKKQSQVDKVVEQLNNNTNPNDPAHQEIRTLLKQEIDKYEALDSNSSEAAVIMQYLQVLSSVPFNKHFHQQLTFQQVTQVLQKHHYGMQEVKQRVLELIAVYKLKGNLTGKAIMLVGPPGTGKTSLGKSISEALGLKMGRISMGGESDSSYLKGHRKTYIGAYPGKVVQQIRQMGCMNGVLLLDEIDKVGHNQLQGDIQAVLLEILDKEQNSTFQDNYLDCKLDLSNIFVICTANSLHTISQPLLDRMDVIELYSYTADEKNHIFEQHLYKQILEQTGLTENQLQIDKKTIQILIEEYCREPGVRQLQKYWRKITEKVAYKIVKEGVESVKVDLECLVEMIGTRPKREGLYKVTPVGVSVGLAYSSYGGGLVFIESVSKGPGRGLEVTGQLGKVMKESVDIAYTYVQHLLQQVGKGEQKDYFNQHQVHLHVPEGSTPKDGPSAGITVVSALLSLGLNKPLEQGIGMTGEISLNGKVLKIGGVKEKVLAAQREGVNRLIFPQENRQEVQQLQDAIKHNIQFHFVQDYQQVYQLLFS